MKKILLCFSLVLTVAFTRSQGLENIIVETYYISDANDATDTDGGSLPAGSTTYRIFVDMLSGYELQAVYGNGNHELRIETSTLFFNNVDRGEKTGKEIPDNRIDENTVALDSWVAMSGATTLRLGVLKTDDAGGSLVGGANNDGGSAGIAGGLLVNNNPLAGIPLTTSDGLIPGVGPIVTIVGLDLSVFDNVNAGPLFTSNGGAWSVLEGVQGPTADNRVLVAQITTDGEFSFCLNIQLGTPGGGVEQYVSSNPVGAEQYFQALCYPMLAISGCTDNTACNYNPDATEDDGSCTYPGCTDDTACNYVDGSGCDDGSCTYPGCADDTACNYADGAGCDDGSCTYPGCNDPAATNYDPLAGCDDGSCTYYCLGDFDGNGTVNTSDLLVFMSNFGCTSGCGLFDMDNNGAVNTSDLLIFMSTFGNVCP
ncbi:MAG: hypothetical protein SH856_10310 [Flavobacteriales bacterium]|nr:hypothetical protein [Flavobacteriales bacterium]